MAKNFVKQITFKAVAEGFDKTRQQFQGLEKNLESLGKKLQSVGNTLTLSVTAPLTAFAGLAIKEFANAEKATAKVRTQLELTGKSIGLTFEELQKASEDLQNNSIFGDDDILENVSNQLLRVSGLTKDSFLEAQQVIVDMSSALDQDLSTSALQVAKALQDPIQGISSLSRVGISFTKDQEQFIKKMVETGDTVKAQGVILDILSGKFQGVGKAVSESVFGQLSKLKNTFLNLAEVIGGRLVPIIQPFVEKITNLLQNLQKSNPEVLDFAVKLGAVLAVVGPVSIGIGLLVSNISLLVNPITIGITLLAGLTSGLDYLAKKFQFVSTIINGFNTILFSMLGALGKYIELTIEFGSTLVKVGSIVSDTFGLEKVSKFGEGVSKTLEDVSKAVGSASNDLFGTAKLSLDKALKGETADVVSVNDFFGGTKKIIDDATKAGELTGQNFKKGLQDNIPKSASELDEKTRKFLLEADEDLARQRAEKYKSLPKALEGSFNIPADAVRDLSESNGILTPLAGKFSELKEKTIELSETGQIFSNSFSNAFSNIADGTKSLEDSFKGLGKTILNSLFNSAISSAFSNLFKNLGGIFTATPKASTGGFVQLATGGHVIGPGTGTSDSILARLSNGEFVMSAKAVKAFGVNTLHKMNELGKGFFSKSNYGFPSFATGGEVNGSSGVVVNVVNNSSQPVNATASTRFDGRQLIVDAFLEDARVNGPMSQSIQNIYGVRR